MNNILEKLAKSCLYLLIFLVPLFFLSLTAAPVEINKQILAAFLVLTALFCYLFRSVNSRRLDYPRSWLSLAILIFLAATGLSAFFSLARWQSVLGDFIQPDTLLSFLIYGLAFFLIAVFFKKEDFKKIGLCFFVSSVLAAIFGLFQIFGKFIPFNPLGSLSAWGVFIGLGLTTTIAALTTLKLNKIYKIFLVLAGLLFGIILIILNYPFLWIGLAITMAIIAIYKLTAKSDLTLPLIIIIVSLFFVLVNQQLPSLLKIPIEIRPDLSSTAVILKNTLTGKQIFWGSGPATFGLDYDFFRPQTLNQSAFWYFKFNQGFSFLATLIITLGLLGILAFLFILFILARRILKILKDGNEELLIVAAGLSFLLIILFVYPASYVQLLYLFIGMGILAIGANRSYQIDFDSGEKWRKTKNLAILSGAVILLVFVLSGIYSLGQKYVAAIYFAKGLTGSSTIQSLEHLNKAVQLDHLSDNYWRALSQVLLAQANELIRTDQTQGSNNIAGAVSAARRAAELNPKNSLNWSNLGNIYENIIPIKGADALAEQSYNQAITLNPNNPQGFVDLAKILMISEKIDEAKSNLEQSINLKTDYLPAHYLLGILYRQNNQTDQAQNEFEIVVALDENYSNARYFLGLIYDQKNQKQKAIEQFEKINNLNPDNQEIKKILENLKAGRSAL